MVIQTLDKKYVVVKYCSSDSRMERFICQEESDGKRYTVIRIKDRDWISKTMAFLVGEMENKKFTDFTYCFAGEDYFHVVLSYAEGISLREKLQNEICTLEERLAVGRHIFERAMLLNMSDYFLQECLRPEHIVVLPNLDVAFSYELDSVFRYDQYSFAQVRRRLLQVIDFLFGGELKKKMLPPLTMFYHTLKTEKWKDIMEIYQQYRGMCSEVVSMPPGEMAMPKTWIFLTWERIRQYIKPLKKILAVVLFLLAVFYLIYTVRESMKVTGEKKVFEYIGTLEIKD